jgi:hypothetical protein
MRILLILIFLGDDAKEVQWIQLDRNHNLYASHEQIIRKVIKKHGAYEYWHEQAAESTGTNR